jgi:hypothetical protein
MHLENTVTCYDVLTESNPLNTIVKLFRPNCIRLVAVKCDSSNVGRKKITEKAYYVQ